MPAPVANRRLQKGEGVGNQSAQSNSKTRIRRGRRRGRTLNGIASDDEIVEREARSDSDTESTLQSDSDSDISSIANRSPPRADNDKNTASAFASATHNWSEMVTEEETAVIDLPVIDFADLDSHLGPSSSVPPGANGHSSAVNPSTDPVHIPETSGPRRLPHTARQAYQQRLEDPSYVPRVGEFWGHDDRLMEKDLRSLSGWWRGKWRGRGAGRAGFGAGWASRGRGASFGASGRHGQPSKVGPGHESNSVAADSVDSLADPTPPVERPWTHDGYEAMKEADARREAQRSQANSSHGRGGFRGFRGGSRGGWNFGQRNYGPNGAPHHSPDETSQAPQHLQRPWYPRKPERSWTKHADGYLHNDPTLRPTRPGQGFGVRVKLPGSNSPTVLRLPTSRQLPATSNSTKSSADRPIIVRLPSAPSSQLQSPASFEKENAVTVAELPADEPFQPPAAGARIHIQATVLDLMKIRLLDGTSTSLIAPKSDVIPSGSSMDNQLPKGDLSGSQLRQAEDKTRVEEEPKKLEQMEGIAHGLSLSSVKPYDERGIQSSNAIPPVLGTTDTAQMTHSPVAYAPSYPYPPGLPVGVAMGENGMYYEIATGRSVYLNLPPMFAHTPPPALVHPHHGLMPRPGSVSFLPGQPFHPMSPADYSHHQHMAAFQRFTPESPFGYPPPPATMMFDPATGTPIFSLPRQTTRVEIRAPPASVDRGSPTEDSNIEEQRQQPSPPVSDRVNFPSSNSTSRSSTLRAALNAEPFRPSASPPPAAVEPREDGFYYSSDQPSDNQNSSGAEVGGIPYPVHLPHPGVQYYYPLPGPAYVWESAPVEYEYPYDPHATPTGSQYDPYPTQAPPMVYY